MLPVYFNCVYSLNRQGEHPCKAVFTVFLPAGPEGELLTLLQGPNFVLRDRLTPDWGKPSKRPGFRERSYPVFGSDWASVEAEISILQKEIEETLRKNKLRNESVPEPPQDWERILAI